MVVSTALFGFSNCLNSKVIKIVVVCYMFLRASCCSHLQRNVAVSSICVFAETPRADLDSLIRVVGVVPVGGLVGWVGSGGIGGWVVVVLVGGGSNGSEVDQVKQSRHQ